MDVDFIMENCKQQVAREVKSDKIKGYKPNTGNTG